MVFAIFATRTCFVEITHLYGYTISHKPRCLFFFGHKLVCVCDATVATQKRHTMRANNGVLRIVHVLNHSAITLNLMLQVVVLNCIHTWDSIYISSVGYRYFMCEERHYTYWCYLI